INFGGKAVNLAGLTASQLTSLGLSPQYAGLAIFQDRNATAPITLSGQSSVNITGTVYAAAATVTVSGNASLSLQGDATKRLGSHLLVADLAVSGNGAVNVDASNNKLEL